MSEDPKSAKTPVQHTTVIIQENIDNLPEENQLII